MLLGFVLLLQFGFPSRPVGAMPVSRSIHSSWGSVAMTLLMFYVVDATRLCRRLILIMIGTRIEWPERLLAREAAVWRGAGLRTRMARHSVHCQSTAVISAMIYHPFVIVFLMAVARHSYFDRWDFPAGLLSFLPRTRSMRSAMVCFFGDQPRSEARSGSAIKTPAQSLSDDAVSKTDQTPPSNAWSS